MVQVAQQMQQMPMLQSQMAAAAMYGHQPGVMFQGQPGQPGAYPLAAQMQFGGGHYGQ